LAQTRLFTNKNILIILGVIFVCIAIPRIIFPDLDHGDEFADADVLNAAANFVTFGFIKTHFLPFFSPQFDTPEGPYTHYPPLTQIFYGIVSILFRTDSLYFFRIIALFFTFLNLIFWYFFIRKITGSPGLGFLCAIFYLTNPFFIYGADALNHASYSDFLRSFILYVFLIMLGAPRNRKTLLLWLLWILNVIGSLVSFEYIIFLSLFFILFRYFFKAAKSSLSWKAIFVLLTAPVFGFLLHFLQNAWYFGSFQLAFQDFKNIAIQRIVNSADAPVMTFYAWWNYVIVRNFSLIFLFNYLLLFMLSFYSYLLYHRLSPESKKELNPLLRLFILLAVCGVSWYIAFPSHSWAHAFVGFLVRHLVPVASVGFTIFCFIIIRYIKENLSFRRYANIFLILIIVTIAITGIRNSQLPVTPGKIKGAQEFIKFKECLLKLNEISQQKDEVAVNYFRFPFIRYYTNRHCVAIFNKPSLERLSVYPRYFIFLPYNNQDAQVLYEYLKDRYTPLWQCNSLSFPAVFFELKK